MKRAKKLSSGVALVFVVLIMGLLAGSASATTIEQEIGVSPDIKIDYPGDTTPPTITITCSPENPTADQEITFIATASDISGIDKIEILVNAEKVEECSGSRSCTYIGGPYPDYAGTSVSYGANAYDKAGNRAWTGYKSVYISEARAIIPPTAIISASPTEINEGEGVSFSAEASSDQDGYIVSYDWDFGDGYTEAGINVEHTYSHSGHYTATLTVTDSDGLSGSNRIEITVNPFVIRNIPPTAYFDISPNPASMGETVTFEGYGEDEDGEVMECRWTFPDGRIRLISGGSDYFEDEDVQAGGYGFAVRDDDGAWSEEARVELELEAPPTIPWTWILAATVLVIAAALIIIVAMKKPSQLQITIETVGGIESLHEPELQHYTINVEVRGGIGRL